MNIALLYAEWKKANEIELTDYPYRIALKHKANIIAVQFRNESGDLLYFLEKCRADSYRIVDGPALKQLINESKSRSDALIFVSALEDLSDIKQVNVRGDIIRFMQSSDSIRGEPRNVRV